MENNLNNTHVHTLYCGEHSILLLARNLQSQLLSKMEFGDGVIYELKYMFSNILYQTYYKVYVTLSSNIR